MAIIANDTAPLEISYKEIDELLNLLDTSSYEAKAREKLTWFINHVETVESYEILKKDLLANQVGIDSAINPSQKEINAHIRKIARI